jgi:hypothetical protein
VPLPNITQCNATAKSTGKQCENPAVDGSSKCRVHGGKTPRGADSPNFKHGRYSKHMPEALLSAYKDAQTDPELLSVRQDIALTDAIISSLLPNLDTGESGKAWSDMAKIVMKAQKAYHDESMGNMFEAFHDMEAIIEKRLNHFAAQREISAQIDQRRKLVETEQKISLQGERAISAEQLVTLMSAVLSVINNVITDKQQRYAIASQIDQLIGSGASIERAEERLST